MSLRDDSVPIGERVKFWEEQDRINQELIPRVIRQHELLTGHIAEHENLPVVVTNAVQQAIAGARLVHSVLRTEKQFSAADRTTRNKIQVVQSLTLMSRMGVTTVLATVGGMGGTAAGSAIPFLGNLVGGIVGTAAGAGMGMYLNRHLEPRMLDLALDITDLTNDDLFYYKNKVRIDGTAVSFRQTAIELGASS